MNKNGKCLWIVDTLLQKKELSLRELNDCWEQSSMYDDNQPFHERTFARYKEHIAREYRIYIEYNHSTRKYYVENVDEIKENALYRYLLSAYRIAGLNTLALQHREKLMLEPTPTGTEHLTVLLEAIEAKQTVLFDYTSYYGPERQSWELIPCFLRIFEGRWYLIAEYLDRKKVKIYALERMHRLRRGTKCLSPSPEITPDKYYSHTYGIIREERAPKYIRLRAGREQRRYLRSQPLHASQEETITSDSESIFTYYLRPSFDFYQKILWMREKVEIVSPGDVRDELAAIVDQIAQMYKTK